MIEWGARWEGGSGWRTHVHPRLIHVNVWQKSPQYCKVFRFQLEKKSLFLPYTENGLEEGTWNLVKIIIIALCI